MTTDLKALRAAAEAATPGPWMRLFGERIVYDRMKDGCRGIPIVLADTDWTKKDAANLDFIALANPATILKLLDDLDRAEAGKQDSKAALCLRCKGTGKLYGFNNICTPCFDCGGIKGGK